jgi:hypothetical protein
MDGIKRGPILVRANEQDNETQNYISDIRSLLNDAGYPGDFLIEMGIRVIPTPNDSVSLVLTDKKNVPEYVGPLQRAFKSIGIQALAVVPEKRPEWLKDGDIVVFIHKKPE